ncbi:MAG TPA: hypothetical protein VGG83_06395 [Trebonia sp.]
MASAAKRLDAATASAGVDVRMPPLAMSMRIRSSKTKSGRRRPASCARRARRATERRAYSRSAAKSQALG